MDDVVLMGRHHKTKDFCASLCECYKVRESMKKSETKNETVILFPGAHQTTVKKQRGLKFLCLLIIFFPQTDHRSIHFAFLVGFGFGVQSSSTSGVVNSGPRCGQMLTGQMLTEMILTGQMLNSFQMDEWWPIEQVLKLRLAADC